jgi:AraC family transcriptional regulator of adaptative response/methylated-DNA-[protein]-cysteine methyltransferase
LEKTIFIPDKKYNNRHLFLVMKNFKIIPITIFKQSGKSDVMNIKYRFCDTPFGEVLIAKTEVGICMVSMISDEKQKSIQQLVKKFSNASFELCIDMNVDFLDEAITNSTDENQRIIFHLEGTPFQIKVWNALLKIPYGKTVTYGDVAKEIGMPNAQRAVGTAIGNNPVFFLIPCHRVIRKSGETGNYFYGTEIKKKILEYEKARIKH